jgi:ubiquinone/menaquinone biosynthesis C-methylase UbiE
MKKLDRESQKDTFRERLVPYTRRAFEKLPRLDHPSILDIGCGSGVPTMELARLSNGQVVALDISQSSLDELESKIESAGLSNRIKTVKGTLFEIDFPDEAFDILWSEGSIHFIGFDRGLREWRRLLKPGGFLIVHDEIRNLALKLSQILRRGYLLLGHFTISEEIWRSAYFEPLEQRIQQLRGEHRDDPDILDWLAKEQREVDMFKKDPIRFASVFMVMQKTSLGRES